MKVTKKYNTFEIYDKQACSIKQHKRLYHRIKNGNVPYIRFLIPHKVYFLSNQWSKMLLSF